MRRLILFFAVALALTIPAADAQSRTARRVLPTNGTYSTTFSAGTENPISESGVGVTNTGWINGNAVGLDWSNIQTTTGKAFGTQTEACHGAAGCGTYNDSIVLKRPPFATKWPDDIDIRARVFITSRSGWTGSKEVELIARGSITGNRARFYEAIFSVLGGTTYYEIVRWEGVVGSTDGGCTTGCAFTSLNFVTCTGVDDLTYIRFTAVGSLLTQYTSTDGSSWTEACSGTAHVSDSTYKQGMPGFGHWTNGNGTISTWGISQWSAQ